MVFANRQPGSALMTPAREKTAVINNASAESAASLEAINRAKSVEFYKVTASGERIPLNAVDGVDYVNLRYLKNGEKVIQVNKKTRLAHTVMEK